MCTRNPYNQAEVHMIRCRTVMNWTHYTIRATVYSLGKAIKYVLWIVFLVLAGKCIAVLLVLSEHIEFVWRIPPSIGGAFVHEWHVWHACFFCLCCVRVARLSHILQLLTRLYVVFFFLFWQRNSSQWRQMDTFNAINLKLNNLFNFFWFYFYSETLIQSFIYKIGVSMINIFKCKTCICSAAIVIWQSFVVSFFGKKMYHNNIIFRNTTHF